MLCPYEKELQLADGRTAHVIAAALNNPALHAVFEEPKKKRARSRVGEHQGQVAADLRGVHAPVRGIDSSHCPQLGAARTPGVHNTRPERPGSAVTICCRAPDTHHSALETFTIRVTPCPCRRTTSTRNQPVLPQQLSRPPRCPRSPQRRGWGHHYWQHHQSRGGRGRGHCC